MHIERIHIERVFDAQASGTFSFESGGATFYGARLPGRIVPRAGATLLLALARPGEWSSMLGWRDAADGRIVLNGPWCNLLYLELELTWWVVPLLVAVGMALGGATGILLVLALVGATACMLVAWTWCRTRHVRAALAGAGQAPQNLRPPPL